MAKRGEVMKVANIWRIQPKLAVMAAAIAVGFASGAQQQEPQRENANRPQANQSAPSTPSTQIARSDAGTQSLEQHLQSHTLRVSKLVGMELHNRTGDNLGEVRDVIRGTAPGQDMQLIVQVGGEGADGSDEKMIAIPLDEIQIGTNGNQLSTNRTREQLAAAPSVQLERRSGGDAARLGERSSNDADRDTANRGGAQQSGAAGVASASLSERRMADLVGASVVGNGGDNVGEIDDIVISTAGADSVRAVLQVGGIAGLGEKRVALPLSQITVERSADGEPTLRAAMDGEALQRLPEFEYEEQTEAL
jgi:sporulation protein YlmC with PRC-barrel domain